MGYSTRIGLDQGMERSLSMKLIHCQQRQSGVDYGWFETDPARDGTAHGWYSHGTALEINYTWVSNK